VAIIRRAALNPFKLLERLTGELTLQRYSVSTS
jgi:hypothetical protein